LCDTPLTEKRPTKMLRLIIVDLSSVVTDHSMISHFYYLRRLTELCQAKCNVTLNVTMDSYPNLDPKFDCLFHSKS
jgi:hypothetical protein